MQNWARVSVHPLSDSSFAASVTRSAAISEADIISLTDMVFSVIVPVLSTHSTSTLARVSILFIS